MGVASWFHSIRSAEDWRVAEVGSTATATSPRSQFHSTNTQLPSNRHALNYIAGRGLHIDDALDSSSSQLPVSPNWNPHTHLVSSIDPDLACRSNSHLKRHRTALLLRPPRRRPSTAISAPRPQPAHCRNAPFATSSSPNCSKICIRYGSKASAGYTRELTTRRAKSW